jgi:hypothetical protein
MEGTEMNVRETRFGGEGGVFDKWLKTETSGGPLWTRYRDFVLRKRLAIRLVNSKGKALPLQAWTGLESGWLYSSTLSWPRR